MKILLILFNIFICIKSFGSCELDFKFTQGNLKMHCIPPEISIQLPFGDNWSEKYLDEVNQRVLFIVQEEIDIKICKMKIDSIYSYNYISKEVKKVFDGTQNFTQMVLNSFSQDLIKNSAFNGYCSNTPKLHSLKPIHSVLYPKASWMVASFDLNGIFYLDDQFKLLQKVSHTSSNRPFRVLFKNGFIYTLAIEFSHFDFNETNLCLSKVDFHTNAYQWKTCLKRDNFLSDLESLFIVEDKLYWLHFNGENLVLDLISESGNIQETSLGSGIFDKKLFTKRFNFKIK